MSSAPRQQFRFGRDRRLRNSGDFARLKEQGRRLAVGCLALNWVSVPSVPDAWPGTRVGIITSRKVGNAVGRNRARRLLREAFRRHQHQFTGPHELVLVARASIAGMSYAGVERDLLEALRRARVLAANPDSVA